jgi:hypothetical protein
MPTNAQSQAIGQSIGAIRAAQNALLNQGRQTTDPLAAAKISNEYNALDSVLNQLVQAQAVSDDATFQKTVPALQQESTALDAQAKAISQIIGAVATAAQIAGYLAQAATAIASL